MANIIAAISEIISPPEEIFTSRRLQERTSLDRSRGAKYRERNANDRAVDVHGSITSRLR